MAISLVTNVVQAAPGTSASVNTTGATFLAVFVSSVNASTTTVSDSKSNKWHLVASDTTQSSAVSELYVAPNPIVGSGHTLTLTNGFPTGILVAFSGITPLMSHNFVSNSNASALSIQGGSITPVGNDALILSCLSYLDLSNTASVNAGFTIINQAFRVAGVANGFALGYLVQTTAAAVNPQWSWAGANDPTSAINAYALAPVAATAGGGSFPFCG